MSQSQLTLLFAYLLCYTPYVGRQVCGWVRGVGRSDVGGLRGCGAASLGWDFGDVECEMVLGGWVRGG